MEEVSVAKVRNKAYTYLLVIPMMEVISRDRLKLLPNRWVVFYVGEKESMC